MADPRGRRPRRRVDGVLLVDKPIGRSSNAVLQHARHLFSAEKAGHTGTLDPLASGLLPLCFGEATKFAQGLLDARKAYLATVRFGVATTTGDAEGEVVAELPITFGRADLEQVLGRFVGTIAQVPPRYAALKYQGRNYYEYARDGIEIPRVARPVEIHALQLLDWAPPLAVVRVDCGKGTYVRTLAEDIATALGSCAHLAALRRVVTGPFAIEEAITLDALEALDAEARVARLLPIDAPLVGTARLDLPPLAVQVLCAGRQVPLPVAVVPGGIGSPPVDAACIGSSPVGAACIGSSPVGAAGASYRAYGADGRFIGVVELTNGKLRAVRLVRPD